MNRRAFLCAVAVTPVLAALAAACGDPDQAPVATDPTTPGIVPDTSAPAGIAHPTGADEVVLRLAYEGGFVPAGFAFVNTPAALVGGDRRLFVPGATTLQFPGPLLPTVIVRNLTEDEIQAVLRVVSDAGLLSTPPGYSGGDNVADAPNTVLTINAAGGSFVHSAYALGITDPEIGDRRNQIGRAHV